MQFEPDLDLEWALGPDQEVRFVTDDRKPVVYIAGPMTGYENYNYPSFFAAQDRWEADGWDVLNPASIPFATPEQERSMTKDETRAMFMRQDLEWVMAADAVALLPGWFRSRGAKTELAVAKILGLDIYDAATMERLSPPPVRL